LGRAQEDSGALLPGQAVPVVPGLAGGADRALDLGRAALVDVGEHVRLLVRHHRLARAAGADFLAADHEWDVEPLALHLLEPPLQALALGGARRVVPDRLVARGRRAEDGGNRRSALMLALQSRRGAEARSLPRR